MVVGLNGQNLESAVSPVAAVYKADEEIALILHQLMVAGTVKVMEKNLGLVSEGTVQVSYTFRLIGSKSKHFTLSAGHCVWLEWSSWSNCSAECGGGIKVRSRASIPAAFGGRPCTGSSSQQSECNSHHCPSKLNRISSLNMILWFLI